MTVAGPVWYFVGLLEQICYFGSKIHCRKVLAEGKLSGSKTLLDAIF